MKEMNESWGDELRGGKPGRYILNGKHANTLVNNKKNNNTRSKKIPTS